MTRRNVVPFISVVLFAACAREDWSPERLTEGTGRREAATLEKGREVYTTYCVGCHGERGDGQGVAARFLNPKPRDFRTGRIKFAGVPAGSMPRDEDLLRTVTYGLAGTSMPAWNLLPNEDRVAVVQYVKTFREGDPVTPGAPVPIGPDPFRKKPARGIALGESVYHGIAACSSCHPAYVDRATVIAHMKEFEVPFSGFRDNMYDSVEKDSEWGAPIKPPNFLIDRVKAGSTHDDLVRTIAAGVGGTAMPSWGGSLSNQQLWGLAYYVSWLVSLRGTPEGAELRRKLDTQAPAPPPEAPAEPNSPKGT